MTEEQLISLVSANILWILIAVFAILVVFRGLKIVPNQSNTWSNASASCTRCSAPAST